MRILLVDPSRVNMEDAVRVAKENNLSIIRTKADLPHQLPALVLPESVAEFLAPVHVVTGELNSSMKPCKGCGVQQGELHEPACPLITSHAAVG